MRPFAVGLSIETCFHKWLLDLRSVATVPACIRSTHLTVPATFGTRKRTTRPFWRACVKTTWKKNADKARTAFSRWKSGPTNGKTASPAASAAKVGNWRPARWSCGPGKTPVWKSCKSGSGGACAGARVRVRFLVMVVSVRLVDNRKVGLSILQKKVDAWCTFFDKSK